MPTYKSHIELSAAYDEPGTKSTRIPWRNALGHYIYLPQEAIAAAYSVAQETAARMKLDAPKANNRSPRMRHPSPARPPGRLRKNIRPYKTADGGAVEWNSSGTADHWAPVEFGAGRHPISGPNGISFRGSIPPGPRKGLINVPMVNHPGNRAQPYIRPNIEWAKDELWRRVTGLGSGSANDIIMHGAPGRIGVDATGSVFMKAKGSQSHGGKKPL